MLDQNKKKTCGIFLCYEAYKKYCCSKKKGAKKKKKTLLCICKNFVLVILCYNSISQFKNPSETFK